MKMENTKLIDLKTGLNQAIQKFGEDHPESRHIVARMIKEAYPRLLTQMMARYGDLKCEGWHIELWRITFGDPDQYEVKAYPKFGFASAFVRADDRPAREVDHEPL